MTSSGFEMPPLQKASQTRSILPFSSPVTMATALRSPTASFWEGEPIEKSVSFLERPSVERLHPSLHCLWVGRVHALVQHGREHRLGGAEVGAVGDSGLEVGDPPIDRGDGLVDPSVLQALS